MDKTQILNTLKRKALNNLDIEQILNYLETLDYDLQNTKYIGKIISKNERLAKFFFLRDQLIINTKLSDNNLYINEILDQCIDWSDFWRLLVVKKGFCCIRLSGESRGKVRFTFLAGPNILTGSPENIYESIYEN